MQIFITNLECLFQLFVVVVWNFELYMLPLGLLLLLVWNFLFSSSRDTPDMVSKYKRNCFPWSLAAWTLTLAVIPAAVHGGHVRMGGWGWGQRRKGRAAALFRITSVFCSKWLLKVGFLPSCQESEHRGFMDKLYAIQDVFISVQSALDEAASYGERIKKCVSPSERLLKTFLMDTSKHIFFFSIAALLTGRCLS